jgi:RNA polymerase sigma-70 factor (ECF subfamily)
MTGNLAVAEELAQEVFLRVYRSRESYRAEAKFTTWLYRIATNLGVNYARDHRHEKAAQSVYLDQPDAETGTTPDVADSRHTVEQELLRRERMAGIRAQVMSLPERQRQAVLMHKYQEMDYREIGAVLKLSESATKSLLFRAYQTLRERLTAPQSCPRWSGPCWCWVSGKQRNPPPSGRRRWKPDCGRNSSVHQEAGLG